MTCYKDKTRQKFKNAMLLLVEQKPLEKITINNIADKADLTRQTFYTYYQNKFDLLYDIHEDVLAPTLKQIGYTCSWAEGVIAFFSMMRRHERFYSRAFSGSIAYNSLYHYQLTTVMETYERLIHYKSHFDEKSKFALEIYCRGAVGMVSYWACTGMKQSPEKLVDLFFNSMPSLLRDPLLTIQPETPT